MRLLFLIPLLAMLAGCPSMTQPLHAPVEATAESPAQKATRLAHASIDEANAALTAFNVTIGNNAAAGIWTKAQAQEALDQSKELGKGLDVAREAMRLGDITSAATQAELVKKLLITLQRKVAEKARDAS